MTLEKRRIGTTDIEVTALGFGGAPLGAVGSRVDEDTAGRLVRDAFEAGICYFDTAPLYGHGLSEKRVGSVLRTLPRDEFVLSSKVGRLLVPDGEANSVRDDKMRDSEGLAIRYDYSYDAARRSLEESLAHLGLDRVDIVLCHDIDTWTHGDRQPGIYQTAANGVLPALQDLRSEGVIRAFGLGVNEWQVCDRVLEDFEPDCFLLAGRFTLLEQEPLQAFLPRCLDRNVSIIIGGPYNSGLLAVQERKRATYDYKPVDDERWERARAIREICEAHQIDIRAAALQYPLRHPAVASVIPGCWRQEELSANLNLIDETVPDALWRDLDAAGYTAYVDPDGGHSR